MNKIRKMKTNKISLISSENKKSYEIKNIPFISQETSIFCAYACPAMIIKYHGIETELDEVLYFSGIGYSLGYPLYNKKFLPIPGYLLCQTSYDRKYLGELYGLDYEYWQPKINVLSDKERWDQYLKLIKKYISKNIPILTTVNTFFLFPMTKQIKIPRVFWNWASLLGTHNILITGINEKQKKISYYDPAIELRESKNNEITNWIDQKNLYNAVSTATMGKNSPKFLLEIFKIKERSLTKKEAFEISHKRNIERMFGNKDAYAKRFSSRNLGIDALKAIKNEFKNIDDKNLDLIDMHKNFKLKNELFSKIVNVFYNTTTFFNQLKHNIYEHILIEKKYILRYLEKNKQVTEADKKEIDLIKKEIKRWEEFIEIFSELINMKLVNKFDLKNKVEDIINLLDDIINIENMIVHFK